MLNKLSNSTPLIVTYPQGNGVEEIKAGVAVGCVKCGGAVESIDFDTLLLCLKCGHEEVIKREGK